MSRFVILLLTTLVTILCSLFVLIGAGYWQISLTMCAVGFVLDMLVLEEAFKQ